MLDKKYFYRRAVTKREIERERERKRERERERMKVRRARVPFNLEE